MNIAIIDDDKNWIKREKQQVMDYWKQDAIVFTYPSGNAFLAKKQSYDLILMDIEMPEMDGFDTIKEYRKQNKNGLIFLLTTRSEPSRKENPVEVFRHIDKTQMEEALQEGFDSAKLRLKREEIISLPVKNMEQIQIPLKNIVYFKAEWNAVKLRTNTGEYLCTESISNLNQMLNTSGFYMPHRRYLLNTDWVQSFDKKQILMKNGDKLRPSRLRYEKWINAFIDWKYSVANM